MKRYISFASLLLCLASVSCKSTDSTTTTTGNESVHGKDASGNVTMAPPPAGQGLQMEIEPWDVPNEQEIQGNFYFQLPSDVDYPVGRIEVAMNEGTHHMNCFRSPIIFPLDSGVARKIVMHRDNGRTDTVTIPYQAQFNSSIVWNQSDMMIEAQVPYLNWVLPKLPDGSQTAVTLAAKQNMIIENHFVNVSASGQTTPNGKGKIIINLWKATGANLVQTSMMVAKETALELPPHKGYSISKNCLFNVSAIRTPGPIYLLGMTGHFHSRGRTFTVDKMTLKKDALGNFTSDMDSTPVQPAIYKSAAWNEPPFTAFDPPIVLNAGEFIRYTATYYNNTDSTMRFGPHVATQEHCNLFSWFTPSWNNGQTLYDNVP